MWQRSEEERLMLLRSAIAEGVDYVDLEEEDRRAIDEFITNREPLFYDDE